MSNFTAKIAGLATLALAALPALALSTNAYAAPVSVRVADLDLGSSAGMRTFDLRVQRAGAQLCGAEHGLTAQSHCQGAVRAEAEEKLAQYLNGRAAVTASR